MTGLFQFWRNESGQDLIEYSLLITFIAIASLILILGAAPAIDGIWSTANTQMVAANNIAATH